MKEYTRSKGKNKRSNRRGKTEKREEDVAEKTSWPVKTGPNTQFVSIGNKATHDAQRHRRAKCSTTPRRKREICYLFYCVIIVIIIIIIIIIQM